MFILFAQREVREQHGPASGAPLPDQSVTPIQRRRGLLPEEDSEHINLIVHNDESRSINVASLEIDWHHILHDLFALSPAIRATEIELPEPQKSQHAL